MGLIPRQPTVEELGWGNSPFPIPAFSLQPFAFSLFFIIYVVQAPCWLAVAG
ncbi:MAG: hypothetical protein AAF316_13050 [Cyanobacteria bacterium P01_A01_bin.80]